jgi:hypothetical protein
VTNVRDSEQTSLFQIIIISPTVDFRNMIPTENKSHCSVETKVGYYSFCIPCFPRIVQAPGVAGYK